MRESLTEKLKVATEATLSAEERATSIDELLNEEERRQNEMQKDLKTLREMQYKKTNELEQSRREEKFIETQIQGTYAALRNLNSKITKLDHDSLKQQEILYNQVKCFLVHPRNVYWYSHAKYLIVQLGKVFTCTTR